MIRAEEMDSIEERRQIIADEFVGLIFSAYLEPRMVKRCVAMPGAIRAQGKCVQARYIGTDKAPDYELVLEGKSGRRATITINAYHAIAYDSWESAQEDK